MKALLILLSLAIAIILMNACSTPPKVAQGTVINSDTESNIMVIVDESTPGSTLEFSLQGAEIGAELLPGDTVRVAYREEGGKLVALRIMNITRQAELKESGGAH